MNAQHTATPWSVWSDVNGHTVIRAENGDYIARPCEYGDQSDFPFGHEHNAAFIVRACNAHERLVLALRMILQDDSNMINSAQRALAERALADAAQ